MSRRVYQRAVVLHTPFLIIGYVLVSLCTHGCALRSDQSRKLAAQYYSEAECLVLHGSPCRFDVSTAVRCLYQSYQKEPSARAASFLATLLLSLGCVQRSAVWFCRACKDAESVGLRHEITNNYACLLAEVGMPQHALRLWRRLAGDPAYSFPECAWYNSGRCYCLLGKKEFARAAWARALYAMRLR